MPDRPALDQPAPSFALPTHDGGTWSLDEQVGAGSDRPVVLVFHRHIH